MPFIYHSPFLNALGWSLLNSIWQMAAGWLLYIIITDNNKRFSARIRHSLGLILLSAGAVFFICNLTAYIVNPSFSRPAFILSGWMHPEPYNISFLLPAVSCSYLLVLLILSVRSVSQYLHIQKLRGSDLITADLYWSVFAEQRSRQLGIGRKVKVWISSLIDVPQTIGFLKPVILLPVAMINHLSQQQAETILLHELMHIRRNDYLINIFLMILGTVFFFNPFARLLIRNMKKEREYSCDDMVMASRYPVHTYASALIMLEKARIQRLSFALASVGNSNKLLLERVKRMTGHPNNAHRLHFSVLPAMLLSGLVLLFCTSTSNERAYTAITTQNNQAHLLPAKTIAEETTLHTVLYEIERTDRRLKKNTKISLTPRKIKWTSIKNPDTEQAPQVQVNYATKQEVRDFSNESSANTHIPLEAMQNQLPFVPASSFAYPPTADSLEEMKQAIRTEAQRFYMDLKKQEEALKQMIKKKRKQVHIVYI